MSPALANTNKAPLLFCAPGPKDGSTAGFNNPPSTQGGASSAPWPGGKNLLVKFHSGHTTFDKLREIIMSALTEWFKHIHNDTLTYQWVEGGNADIRISLDDAVPSWSCLGARAAQYGQDSPTMNLRLGGWSENKTVFSHKDVYRAALHLFGHALGL
jgi:hypothetical protein